MIHALKPLAPEPAQEQFIGGRENPAVTQCEAVWYQTYRAVMSEKKGKRQAILEANWAYRQFMPAPVGHSNISNFIACVIYGMMLGRFEPQEGPRLLYGAQVALNALGARPRTQQ